MIPVFIGGTGRSGTTIIKRALTSRSEFVGFRLEMRIIVDPDGVLDLIEALDDGWSPYKGDLAVKRFRKLIANTGSVNLFKRAVRRGMFGVNISPPSYIALGLEEDLPVNALSRAFEPVLEELLTGTSRGGWIGSPGGQVPPKIEETDWIPRARSSLLLSDALRGIFGQLKGAGDAKAFVEDTPFNILHARELFELFPDMYLVNVYRDPKDTAASYMGRVWGGDDIELTCKRIAAILSRWEQIRQDLPKDRVFNIPLEELAKDPRGTLTSFFDALEIEPGNLSNVISVKKANIGRWRTTLTDDQIEVVQRYFPDAN